MIGISCVCGTVGILNDGTSQPCDDAHPVRTSDVSESRTFADVDVP